MPYKLIAFHYFNFWALFTDNLSITVNYNCMPYVYRGVYRLQTQSTAQLTNVKNEY
jgi:hypothetical protein